MYLIFLATALILGTRHALDPDHVVAVSTLVAEERRLWPAARLGLIWGFGHLLPLTLLGLPVLLLQFELPESMELVVDLGVGLLLIGLGARTMWRLHQERMHFHVHHHDGEEHGHFHFRDNGAGHAHHHHVHPLPSRNNQRLITFFIGVMHGLAGSGAAAVLALTAAPTVTAGVGYLLVFGLGTMIGMFAMTLLIAAPALSAFSRFAVLNGAVRLAAGLASAGMGVWMWYQILPQLLE